MELLGKSSYGYQIMDRSRHTITKYLNDEKTDKAINESQFKRLNTVEKVLLPLSHLCLRRVPSTELVQFLLSPDRFLHIRLR